MGDMEAFDEDVVDSVEVGKILLFLGDDFMDDALHGSQRVISLKDKMARTSGVKFGYQIK
jgi:hypothetical protein